MSLLFHYDENQNCLLHPEVVKLCPSLSTLKERELIYIILHYDYNSPLKQFPEHERKRQAMLQAFDENEYDLIDSPRILAAASDYVSLQYNPKIETARIYQQKIDKYHQLLIADDAPSSSKKIGDAIDDLTKRISALHKDYDTETEKQGVIKGKMQLSHLEKVMANRKNFLAITAKSKK
jgi:hypothetical protein